MKHIALILSLFITLTASAQSGYNAYMLDKLTVSEAVALGEIIPRGLSFRLGGNEYLGRELPTEFSYTLQLFLEASQASGVSAVVPLSGIDLTIFDNLTYGNEPWLKPEYVPFVPFNIWDYFFRRAKYNADQERPYREGAQKYVREAYAYSEQIGRPVYLNVPLPQSRYLKIFLQEVRKGYNGPVSIHVYGKTDELDYLYKLDKWLAEIKYHFDDVFVGEFNGAFLHQQREVKNTGKHALFHREILKLFAKYGIDEVYYFTLCMTESSMNWANSPIYPKWIVGETIIDSEPNIK